MTAPPSAEEVAMIVKGLTVAERDAICALQGSEWKKWREGRIARMIEGLGRDGLGALRDLRLAERGPPWFLTPLGLAVRNHLIGDPR